MLNVEFGPHVFRDMPVPSGFGSAGLDYFLCVGGMFVAVEAKAPGKSPTDRQAVTAHMIYRAGGRTFYVDGPEALEELRLFLKSIIKRKKRAVL